MRGVATVLAMSLSPPAMAEPADHTVAQTAVEAFFRGCLGTAGQQSSADVWFGQHGFRPASSQATVQLAMGRPGHVWINGDPSTVFAAITRTDAIPCQIMAPSSDDAEATRLFRSAASGLVRPGLEVRSVADAEIKLGDRTGHRVAYRIGAVPLDDGGYDVVLTAAPPRVGGVALLITLSRAEPTKPR